MFRVLFAAATFAAAAITGTGEPASQAPPLIEATSAVVTTSPSAPDGTAVQLDLPRELHLKNCGGSDAAGLCVFTSLTHSAFWHNLVMLQDFRDYMKRYPGGGYPEKVDKFIDQICKARNVPKPSYFHVQSSDLEVLALACRTGRMCGVTYCYSPTGRYGGSRIAHMVTLLAARVGPLKLWCILDNNFPGTYEWMSEEEFRRTYTGGGQGWAVVFTSPGPPPVARNQGV